MMRKSTPEISPDILPEILREVRQSLMRTMPDQTKRFLRDAGQTATASQEVNNHDA